MTIKKLIFLLSFILLLSSCFFLGPVDETVYKQFPSLPTMPQLAGKWKADEWTYKFIKQKGYKAASLYIVLKKDSTFEAHNLPDFSADPFGHGKGKAYNATGKWMIYPEPQTSGPSLLTQLKTKLWAKIHHKTYTRPAPKAVTPLAYKSIDLFLNFSAGKLYPTAGSDEYLLYMKESKPVLIKFIGDPDTGEQLIFIKE